MSPTITIIDGDIVDQHVDCIVNAWNRNLFPWWLLLPQGVSAAIKRSAGLEPFRELRRYGLLRLGAAVHTGPGRLPVKSIIHVAGIGLNWRASEESIRAAVRNAIALAGQMGYRSIAFPVIGAGTGGFEAAHAEEVMINELGGLSFEGDVRIVRFAPAPRESG